MGCSFSGRQDNEEEEEVEAQEEQEEKEHEGDDTLLLSFRFHRCCFWDLPTVTDQLNQARASGSKGLQSLRVISKRLRLTLQFSNRSSTSLQIVGPHSSCPVTRDAVATSIVQVITTGSSRLMTGALPVCQCEQYVRCE